MCESVAASQRGLQGGPAASSRFVHRPEILGVILNLMLKLQQRSVVWVDLLRFRLGISHIDLCAEGVNAWEKRQSPTTWLDTQRSGL